MRIFLLCISILLLPVLGYSQSFTFRADEASVMFFYDFVSSNGEVVQISVVYESSAPTSNVQDLHFYPKERIPDGEYEYQYPSIEGNTIIFKFVVKDGYLEITKVDTDYKPITDSGNEDKVLTLKSRGGYEMLFTFSFNNGQYTGARIEPKINPFS